VHINILDIYHARESFIHQLDPRVKIIATFLIIVTTVLLPERAWVGQAVLFGLLIVLSLSARLGPFFTIRRAIIALPFLLAAVPIPFLTLGPAVWVVPGLGWVVSSYGLIRFMTILVRTWVAVQAGILLSATTEVSDLLWGLNALKAPKLIVSIVGFMVRYLFILADEALRILRARASRSPKLPGVKRPGLIWQGRVAGMMVGSLFLRSLERSERVYAAMLSRGYDGEDRILLQPSMRNLDWIVLLSILSIVLSVIILSLWS
jgi:cobalt/nickel transport system permease protein